MESQAPNLNQVDLAVLEALASRAGTVVGRVTLGNPSRHWRRFNSYRTQPWLDAQDRDAGRGSRNH